MSKEKINIGDHRRKPPKGQFLGPHKQIHELQELQSAQQELYNHLVFSGGGAKGAIYSGVHEQLEKSGILRNIQSVAGSSAGAITAAMIASGITPEDFKKVSSETNFTKLLGKGVLINKDGKPLYDLLHNTINSNIKKYFENDLNKKGAVEEKVRERIKNIDTEIAELSKIKPLPREQIGALEATRDKIEPLIKKPQLLYDINKKTKQNGKITFKDLDLLHALDPIRFKDLVVTGTNRETGELTLFNAQNTPDVEIALACRASASIPLVFKPVKIDINGKEVEFVDGGYRNNIPINPTIDSKEKKVAPVETWVNRSPGDIPENKDIENITGNKDKVREAKKEGRTLVFAFGTQDNSSEAHLAIFSTKEKITTPGKISKFLMDIVFKITARVGGEFKYSESVEKDYQTLREKSLDTVILDTKDVSTLSFKAAQKKADYLHIKGSLTTARQLDNHDLGNKSYKNLPEQEFILQIYENTQTQGRINQIKDIFTGKDKKHEKLLNFCTDQKWHNKDKNAVLSSFIKTAAFSRTGAGLSAETNPMKNIVDMLNNPKTPKVIRDDFLELAGLAGLIDAKPDHKFTTTDFESLINKQQYEMDKTKNFKNLKNTVIKEIKTPITEKSNTNKETKTSITPILEKSNTNKETKTSIPEKPNTNKEFKKPTQQNNIKIGGHRGMSK